MLQGSAVRWEWLGYVSRIISLMLAHFTFFFPFSFFLVIYPGACLVLQKLSPVTHTHCAKDRTLSLAFEIHYCGVPCFVLSPSPGSPDGTDSPPFLNDVSSSLCFGL